MKPDQNRPVPPDPEVRLTAYLLGELSPQETAEVQEALTKDPQLAKLHERLVHTVGLVREAMSQPQAGASMQLDLPKLSLQRREALQARLKTIRPRFIFRPSLKSMQDWMPWVASAAAVLVTLAMLPGLSTARSKAKTDVMSVVPGSRPAPAVEGKVRSFTTGPAAGVPLAAPLQSQVGDAVSLDSSGTAATVWADYDSDGSLDLFVSPGDRPSRTLFLARTNAAGYGLQRAESAPESSGRSLQEQSHTLQNRAAGGGFGGMGGGAGGADAATKFGVQARVRGFYDDSAKNASSEKEAEGTQLRMKAESVASSEVKAAGRVMTERLAEDRKAVGQVVEGKLAATPPASEAASVRRFGRAVVATESKGVPQAETRVPVAGDAPRLGKLFRGAEVKQEVRSGLAPESHPVAGTTEKYDTQPAGVADDAFASAGLSTEWYVQRADGEVPTKQFHGFTAGNFHSTGQADLGVVAKDSNGAAEELAPLPLKLPIPAFMGTPVDIPLGAETDKSLSRPPATITGKTESEELARPKTKKVELSYRYAMGEKERPSAATPPAEPANQPVPALQVTPLPIVKEGVVALNDVAVAAPQSVPPPEVQPEVNAAENRFSTFSLNVSDVSFRLAAASLANNQLPNPATVRSEEFINAFEYRDPEPAAGRPVAFTWERARYPFAHNRDLLRFAVRTAVQGRDAGRPLNLVLVMDNSGSMERADRVATLREALRVLASQLQAQDRLSVVTFARVPRLWADGVPGNQAAETLDRLSSLTPEGGTNLEDAMKAGYATALRNFNRYGVNRVILLTDGAANLGDTSAESLQSQVESHRKRGVATDCFGIGWEGYNDELLETMARHGDGRYGFVNTPEDAAVGFANQLAGALQVAAADVKVQVEFNPQRVTSWRQVGYAKHQLKKEQFRDNTVDAAELGASEAGNAIYVVQCNPAGNGPLGVARLRYRVPSTGAYVEQEWPMEYNAVVPSVEQASPAMRLAATSAAFSELLAGNPYAAEVTPDRLTAWMTGVPEAFAPDDRPAQLRTMIRQYRTVRGQ